MLTSNSITNLADALAKAQGEMPAAPMDSTNPFLHNRFASLGSLINTSQPVLVKHGFSVVQMPFMQDQQVGVLTRLLHSSGEWIEDSLALPIEEEKGKSRAQVLGSIITYLRRYALQSVLRMYADEDTDGNQQEKPVTASRRKKTRATKVAEPRVAAKYVEVAYDKAAAPVAVKPPVAEQWKEYFLKQVHKKAWGIWAWQWAIARSYINETDNLKVIAALNCPQNRQDHAKAMTEIKAVLDSFPKGISQELDEAYTKAHLDDLGPQETKEAEPAWKSAVIGFGPNKGMTLGEMSHELPKKLFGWWANWQPAPYKGETKQADLDLRAALDECGDYMGYSKKEERQAEPKEPIKEVKLEDDVPF